VTADRFSGFAGSKEKATGVACAAMKAPRPSSPYWLRLLFVMLPLATGLTSAATLTYQNPIIPGNLADPAVLRHNGVYYLYATGEVDGDNGTRVFTSTNLVDWSAAAWCSGPGNLTSGRPMSGVTRDSGRFYLYYTVNQTVGVAEADSPLGPFQMVQKFFDQAIDAHLFRDDDGKLYLYYVQLPGFRISVQPMATPTRTPGEPKRNSESPSRIGKGGRGT
jgi:beta-xylosidase